MDKHDCGEVEGFGSLGESRRVSGIEAIASSVRRRACWGESEVCPLNGQTRLMYAMRRGLSSPKEIGAEADLPRGGRG